MLRGISLKFTALCASWFQQPTSRASHAWASCQMRKKRVSHAAGMLGPFSPPPRVSDSDMHHGTCWTHVPWGIPGSLTSGFLWNQWRGNVPGIPGGCATRNFTYLVRGPLGHGAGLSAVCATKHAHDVSLCSLALLYLVLIISLYYLVDQLLIFQVVLLILAIYGIIVSVYMKWEYSSTM